MTLSPKVDRISNGRIDILVSNVDGKSLIPSEPFEVLKIALEDAISMLNVGGRISVITFHSLEDRIVKDIFNKYSKVDSSLSKLPFIPEEYLPKYKLITNITPGKEELEENNRARSSRLRVIEKIRE